MKTPLFQKLLLRTGLASLPLFVGCSLTDIPFVRVGECTSDESCNEALGAECAEYECVPTTDKKGKSFKQCRKIEGEKLDGLDNDCDGIVDNADKDAPALTTVERKDIASGLPEFTAMTIADSSAITQLYVQGLALGNDTVESVVTLSPEGGDAQSVSVVTNDGEDDLDIGLERGCHGPGGNKTADCDAIDQVATAGGSSLGYFAHVRATGCGQGELRVGVIDPEDPAEFIDRGPDFRNPAFEGVATYGSPCTQNSNPDCISAKETYAQLRADGAGESELATVRLEVTNTCGASRPNVAAHRDQALVAFLSAQLDEDVCEKGATDIFGMLLHERIETRGSEFVWGDPSHDGVPDVIGKTLSAQPPALTTMGDLGFLMAHPENSGKLTLTFIPRQPTPPVNQGTDCPNDDCSSREGLETEPLSGVEQLAELSVSGVAEGIRMQWLSIDAQDEGVLLLTWTQGCAQLDHALSDARAYAQALRLDLSGDPGDLPEIVWEGEVINLGTTRSFPLAVPSSAEFVVEGFERDGKSATADDVGGFYVLTRPRALQAVRVAAFDGALVSRDEVISILDDADANKYRYLGARGESAPDTFYFKTTGENSLYQGTFTAWDPSSGDR